MQKSLDQRIEEILLEAGLLTEEKLVEIAAIHEKTGEKIEKILLSGQFINYTEIYGIMASKMGVEYIELENIEINENAIRMLSSEIAVKYNVFPFDIKNNLLLLAMQNPDDIFMIDEIKVYTQMEIKPYLSDKRSILKALERYYKINEGTLRTSDVEPAIIKSKENSANVKAGTNQVDVPNDMESLINAIIVEAMDYEADNIHIDARENGMRIRYKLDGISIDERIINMKNYSLFVDKLKKTADVTGNDESMPQCSRLQLEPAGRGKINLELNILPAITGSKILLKVDKKARQFPLKELGMTENELKTVEGMLEKASGLILVTAPKGGGKTTTCHAMLRKLAEKDLTIVTLENRITERIDGICQINIGDRDEKRVDSLIEAAIDHDTDVILADTEISRYSMKSLINAALGGKLIMITMRLENIKETLQTLDIMKIEPYPAAFALKGIIAQRTVLKECKECDCGMRISGTLNPAEPLGGCSIVGKTCTACRGKGYKGKVGIYELLEMNTAYRKTIIENESFASLEKEYSCKSKSKYESLLKD